MSQYSFSLTTFSPSGKLVQIEYALNAVSGGMTSIGIKGICNYNSFLFESPLARNGVVVATEKKSPSPLVDISTIDKVYVVGTCMEWFLGEHLGLVYSGMGPDARVLVSKARKYVQSYKRVYGEEPTVASLVKELASVMQEFTQSGYFYKSWNRGVRPFGVSLLVAGFDEHVGSSLYQVDPSGSYFAWKASAIGKNMINAKTFLEKRYVYSDIIFYIIWNIRYVDDLELEDAVHTAILTLKEGFEGALDENNIEIGIIGGNVPPNATDLQKKNVNLFRKLNSKEIKDYLSNMS